jgi:3-demethylubiquinone-9 3-methyltransferase (EC 2.1.1.64)
MNMDQAEVNKFDALADRWWDTNGPFRTLHEINPLRLDFIAKGCAGLNGKKVLDVGTGGGLLAEAMARQGAEVTGIDLAEDGLMRRVPMQIPAISASIIGGSPSRIWRRKSRGIMTW